MKTLNATISARTTVITGIVLIAMFTWAARTNEPTHQELMRAHAFKPRNDFTADNARTQIAIDALLRGR